MNQGKTIQKLFFETIRQRLPNHISLVHEIAELLKISYDSAYRRLRGDKELSIDEMQILSSKYSISVDTLFGHNNADILFQPFKLRVDDDGFEEWLVLRSAEILKVKECKTKEVILVARDLPVFYYFDFPILAAFKLFFWKKMLLHCPDHHDKLFDINEIPTHFVEMGLRVLSSYNVIPSVEIWCQETFTRIMQQIEFCRVSGYFIHKQDAVTLFEQLEALIRHMQAQTEQGNKFHHKQINSGEEDENLKIFYNEVLLIDNTAFIQRDGAKTVLMTHNSLDLLITTNPDFCNQVEHALRVIMKTGNHISGTSGLECNRFFTPLFEKLEVFKKESVAYRFFV